MKKIILSISAVLVATASLLQAQIQSNDGNTLAITTAVPFLRVNPDARTGALGDAGMGVSPDANAVFTNTSRLAFIESDFGVAVTFVPWLRGIATDVYMADLVGYYKIKEKQTIAASLRYFSLGNIQFTNEFGDNLNQDRPNEFAFDVNYARQLTKRYSLAIGMRYIYSNLGSVSNSTDKFVSHAFGADLSMFHTNPLKVKKIEGAKINWGLALTNMGSKMSYNRSASYKDFIPANFAVGLGAEVQIDKYNKVSLYTDFNKLLVPTPIAPSELYVDANATNKVIKPEYDKDGNNIPDYKEKSSAAAIFTSWGDAPGGFKEEMSEFTVGVGMEYEYNKLFMARLGYFYEAPSKGARRFLSAGLGIKYSVFQLNFAYNIPTSSQRNPLDNTMRFTMLFDFAKSKKVEQDVVAE